MLDAMRESLGKGGTQLRCHIGMRDVGLGWLWRRRQHVAEAEAEPSMETAPWQEWEWDLAWELKWSQ